MDTELKTIADISKRTGHPANRIRYVARKLRVKPAMRVGLVRLFDTAAVAAMLDELRYFRPKKAS